MQTPFQEERIPKTPPRIPALEVDIARPIWSVMIPAYNCIDYIQAALESVLMQDPGPTIMQVEVVDDCSTDGDVEALVNTVGKGRVQFYRQEINSGSLRNFETCINRAKGRYVHILHGDDRVEPGYYKEIGHLFGQFPEAGAAFTNFHYINHLGQNINIRNKKILNKPGIIKDFLLRTAHKQIIQPPAIVVKRSVYETLGGFYAVHFGEDWEMWSRIGSKYPVAYSPRYLASYRVAHGIGVSHHSFLSGQNIIDIKKVIDIIQEYLPLNKRKKLKKDASAYYSIYCIKIANGLLLDNRPAALNQVRGAVRFSNSITTYFWAARFYLMYLLRFKQIERFFKESGTNKTAVKTAATS